MRDKRHIQSFNEHAENLNSELSKDTSSSISDVIKRLQTDDSEITFGDYFLEVGEWRFIHQLVEGDDDYEDYKLPNGIEVVPLNKSDFDWNKRDTQYRRIVNVL